MFVGIQDISVQIIQLCPLCKPALLFTIISIGRSYPEVVGSNPTEVKFSLTRGDSQINTQGRFGVSAVLPSSGTQTYKKKQITFHCQISKLVGLKVSHLSALIMFFFHFC